MAEPDDVEHWKALAESRQQELESLKEEWQELTESSSELEKTLEAELEAEVQRSQELQEELDAVREQLAATHTDTSASSAQINTLQARATDLEQQVAALKADKTALEQRVEEAEAAARVASSSAEALQHKLERAQEDAALIKDDAEQSAAALQRQVDDLRSQLRDAQDAAVPGGRVAQLEAEVARLKAQPPPSPAADSRVAELQAEVTLLEVQLKDAHGSAASATRVTELEAEVATLEQQLHAQATSAEAKAAELRAAVDAAQSQLQQAAASHAAELEAKDKQLESARAAAATAKATAASAAPTLQNVAQLEERIEEFEDQQRAMDLRMRGKDEEISALHRRLGERTAELTAALERAENAERARRESLALSPVKAGDDDHVLEMQLKIRDLTLQCDQAERDVVAARAKADAATTNAESLQQEVERLQADLDVALATAAASPSPAMMLHGQHQGEGGGDAAATPEALTAKDAELAAKDIELAKVRQEKAAVDTQLAEARRAVTEKDALLAERLDADAEHKAAVQQLSDELSRVVSASAAKDKTIAALHAAPASPASGGDAGADAASAGLQRQLTDARATIAVLQQRFEEAAAIAETAAAQVVELQSASDAARAQIEATAAVWSASPPSVAASAASSTAMEDSAAVSPAAGAGVSQSGSGGGSAGMMSPLLSLPSPPDGSKSVPVLASPPPPRMRSPSANSSPVSRAQVERAMVSLMEQVARSAAEIEDIQRRLEVLLKRERAADLGDSGEVADAEGLRTAVSRDIPQLGGVVEDLLTTLRRLQETVQQREATLLKENGRLLARVHETRGNILVYARVRPPTAEELRAGNVFEVVDVLSDTNLAFYDSAKRAWRPFALDRVMGPEVGQEGVFREVEHVAVSVVDGYRSCIFAYGITGGGKTFTMQGPDESPGVNIRILTKIFGLCEARADTHDFTITLSMLEIYNEELRDLLTTGDPRSARRLEIRTTGTQAGVSVQIPSLTKVVVSSVEEVMRVYNRGCATRSVAATNVHEHSSRSHCVLTVEIKGTGRSSAHGNVMGKLNLVDLAGSERIKKSMVTGDRLVEARSINKSLSALGDVLEALDRKLAHVPYRNSKLTHLLQDSLSANSRTLMICAVSPTSLTAEETLYSLQFAQRTRNIELGPARKMIYYRNVDDTVNRLRHDLNVAASSQEALESSLKQERAARAKLEERFKHSSTDARRHYEDRERVLEDKRRRLKAQMDELNTKYRAEKERRMAEHDELLRLRDQLKAQRHTSAVNAREAAMNESRANTLAMEVERVKDMLMEARSTVAYMRKSGNYMGSRGKDASHDVTAVDALDSPLHAGTPRSSNKSRLSTGSATSTGHRVTSSQERRAAVVAAASQERKAARRANVRRKAFPARVHTSLRAGDDAAGSPRTPGSGSGGASAATSTPPVSGSGIPRRAGHPSPRTVGRSIHRQTPHTAPAKGSRIPTRASPGTPRSSGAETPPVPPVIRPGSAGSASGRSGAGGMGGAQTVRLTRSAARARGKSGLVPSKATVRAKQRSAWR